MVAHNLHVVLINEVNKGGTLRSPLVSRFLDGKSTRHSLFRPHVFPSFRIIYVTASKWLSITHCSDTYCSYIDCWLYAWSDLICWTSNLALSCTGMFPNFTLTKQTLCDVVSSEEDRVNVHTSIKNYDMTYSTVFLFFSLFRWKYFIVLNNSGLYFLVLLLLIRANVYNIGLAWTEHIWYIYRHSGWIC